mgnify:CR=1 FL=1
MNIRTLLIIFVILLSLQGFSQSFSGRVINTNKEPLENVYVYNKNSNAHDHTNFSGAFKLSNSKVNDTIQIGLLGYEKQLITLTKQDLLNSEKTIVLEVKFYELDELFLTNNNDALKSIISLDLALDPVTSSQEVLSKVPGLFIGQHAGGGKAEQIFLRGFDIDHGTDLSLSVDGMPVNMVSHAHGQGYSDLHFLIPELIEKVEFDKGPYNAEYGNFATAGFVDFKTKNSIQKNRVQVEAGSFSTFRVLGMVDLLKPTVSLDKNQDAFLAKTELCT